MDAVAAAAVIGLAADCMHTPERDPVNNFNSRLQLRPKRKVARKRRYHLMAQEIAGAVAAAVAAAAAPADADDQDNDDDDLFHPLKNSPRHLRRAAEELLSTPTSQTKKTPRTMQTPRRPAKAKRRLIDDLDQIAREEEEELRRKKEAKRVTQRLFEGDGPSKLPRA